MMIHSCPQVDLTETCVNASGNDNFYSVETSGYKMFAKFQ